MGLFNFLNREQKQSKQSDILLAMPIFNNGNSYQLNAVIDNLKTFWNIDVKAIEGDNEAAAFEIDGQSVALANIGLPIPWDDIEGTAQYAYNWTSALKKLHGHTGHAIISIMGGTGSPLQRFNILSKVLCSILMTSKAIAVYQGSQSLLIPRQQYINHCEELKESDVCIFLWVYIGLRKSAKGNSAYTYGLKDFEKDEMEVINSKLSLEELYELLYNVTSYVIGNNVTLKEGQTVGNTAEQKLPLKLSKGQFVEGVSIKILT